MLTKLSAEFIGTFWLVLGGCGSAVLAATFPDVGIGLHGVSLAFGLTVLAGVYAFGPISGAHFNPAVTIGLCFAGRFSWRRAPEYILVQVAGAVIASMLVLLLATSGSGGYDASAVDGEWMASDAPLPDGVIALLRFAGDVYLPYLVANAAARAEGAEPFTFTAWGMAYEQRPLSYPAKCLRWLREDLAAMPADAMARTRPVLEATGCWESLAPH